MNKFDGIIFDIDGTLTSTNNLIFASFNHITKKYLNKSYTWKEIQGLFGPTENVIIKDLIKDHYSEAKKDYYDFYSENHNAMANLYSGIHDLIIKLKNNGILLSIYTGKGRESSEITLKETGIFDFFDLVVTGDDIPDHKPSPDGITIFLDTFGLKKDRIIMVGDAPADIKAARNAGIKSASVLWDSYAKEKVLEMGSDYNFHSVEDLADFLLK